MQGEKVAISDQYLAIARKRLKIDGYAAMHFTSIEFSYLPRLSQGLRTQGGQNVKNVLKWRTSELTG